MNPIAANETAHEAVTPAASHPARWSNADDLLVWTVSRLDGGRRHGIEKDCHVVYAMSPGYFVEQTRKFRASAEQCIEMLQRGKKAGTIQRKIRLDSIVSVHSDPRSGRLHIRTINGTHQLDPVTYDEADVLRQIATELHLRMPAGGAEFSQISGFEPTNIGRRDTDEFTDRHELASLENARAEDAPDGYQAPRYDLPADEQNEGPPHHENSLTSDELERLAASVQLDAAINPDNEVDDLPGHITVAGGVAITYEPGTQAASHEPGAVVAALIEPPSDTEESIAEESQHGDEPAVSIPGQDVYERRSTVDPAFPDQFDRRQIDQPQPSVEPATYAEPPAYTEPAAYAQPTAHAEPAIYAEPAAYAQPTGHAEPAAYAEPVSYAEPAAYADPTPYAQTPPVEAAQADETASYTEPLEVQPVAEVPAVSDALPAAHYVQPDGYETAEGIAPSEVFAAPSDPAGPVTLADTGALEDDRRVAEDPSFPSIFDRRGTLPAADDAPGWAQSGPLGEHQHGRNVESEEEDEAPALSADPPTLAPTPIVSGGAASGMGGSVGFNPDFDVNPFR